MVLDETVRALTDRHLSALAERAPGLIDALYVWGSVALGDFRPGRSDVDVLAVTSRPLDAADLTMLAEVHAAMPEQPHYDGVYLDWPAVRAMTDDQPVVPFVVNGDFHTDRPCGELNPVL